MEENRTMEQVGIIDDNMKMSLAEEAIPAINQAINRAPLPGWAKVVGALGLVAGTAGVTYVVTNRDKIEQKRIEKLKSKLEKMEQKREARLKEPVDVEISDDNIIEDVIVEEIPPEPKEVKSDPQKKEEKKK